MHYSNLGNKMTPEERDKVIQLKTEQDALQDAIGIVIKVISDKIISNQIEITKIRGENDIIQKRLDKMAKREARQNNEN